MWIENYFGGNRRTKAFEEYKMSQRPLYLQSNKRVILKWNFNCTKVEESTHRSENLSHCRTIKVYPVYCVIKLTFSGNTYESRILNWALNLAATLFANGDSSLSSILSTFILLLYSCLTIIHLQHSKHTAKIKL